MNRFKYPILEIENIRKFYALYGIARFQKGKGENFISRHWGASSSQYVDATAHTR